MGVANLARYKKWKYHAVTHIKSEYPFLHTTNLSGTTHDFADTDVYKRYMSSLVIAKTALTSADRVSLFINSSFNFPPIFTKLGRAYHGNMGDDLR